MKAEIATKFKETEIGPVYKEWEILPIYDLAIWINGLAFRDINFSNNGKPVIKINELKYGVTEQTQFTNDVFKDDYFLSKGDLLFSWSGSPDTSIDAFWYDLPDGWLNQHIFKIKPKDKVNINFLYYIIKANKYRFIEIARDKQTTGLGHVTISDLKRFSVALPSLNEQKQIAEILSSLDDKIELNRKTNANLEKLASTLFKQWFVDVGNKLPEGWKKGKVSDLIRVESGFPFHSSMFDENGDYKLVTIKNVQDGFFVPECTDSLSEIPSKVPAHCKLKNGDILLSLTGNVGRVCPVYGENYLLNQRVANLVPIDENNRAFTYFLFRQKDFQNTLISISRGTAQQNLSPIETKSLEIPIPSQDMLDRFANVANPIFQKLVENYNEIKNLSLLRDSLLPRLMNGKIRVK